MKPRKTEALDGTISPQVMTTLHHLIPRFGNTPEEVGEKLLELRLREVFEEEVKLTPDQIECLLAGEIDLKSL